MSNNTTEFNSEIKAGGLYVDIGWSTGNIAVFVILGCTVLGYLLFDHFFTVPYSKFAKHEEIEKRARFHLIMNVFHEYRISSKLGWALVYGFPVVLPGALFIFYAVDNNEKIGKFAPSEAYALVLFLGWEMSFIKRFLESQLIQVYSGTIPILTVTLISGGYSFGGLACVYAANQVEGYEFSAGSDTFIKDILCIIGYIVFICLNFHSHLTLRNIRKRNPDQPDKKYYSLHELGHLFVTLVCPHYTFELLFWIFWAAFAGLAMHYLTAGFSVVYLTKRTYITYKWYVSKGLHAKPADVVEAADF